MSVPKVIQDIRDLKNKISALSNNLLHITSTPDDNVKIWIDPSEDGDSTYYTTGDVNTLLAGKAPAGYGLGGTFGDYIADADNATVDGKYRTNSNTLNLPNGFDGMFGVIDVTTIRPDKAVLQKFCPGTDGYQPYSLERRRINGIWKPWEWVNPLMQLGVEYRTTERYMGKPVYVKTVPTGAMPAAAGTSNRIVIRPSIQASEVDNFIHFEGVVTNGTMYYTLPVGYGNTTTMPDISAYLYKYADYVVYCQSSFDMSGYSGTITFWYTKTTD